MSGVHAWIGIAWLLGSVALGQPAAREAVQQPLRAQVLQTNMPVEPVAELTQQLVIPDSLAGRVLRPADLARLPWQSADVLRHPQTNQPQLYSYDQRWHRLRVRNAEPAMATYVVWLASGGYLCDVHVWVEQDGMSRKIGPGDLTVPQYTNSLVFPLRLAAGQSADVYVQATTRYLQLRVTSLDGYLARYQNRDHTTQAILLAYFGMMFIMVVYNGLLWLSLRDPVYGWYLLYLSGFWTFVTFESGVFGYWFALRLPFHYQFVANAASAVFFLALLRFIVVFLRLRELLPTSLPWIRLGYGLNLFSLCFNAWNLLVQPAPLRLYDVLEQTVVIYCVALGGWLGVVAWLRGYRPARFFLLGFAVLAVSAVVFVGMQFNLVPPTPVTVNALYIGSGLEFALLSLALGDRYNLLKAEKSQERARISRDLHDNVGAQLAAVFYGLQLTEKNLADRPELKNRLRALQGEVRDTMTQLRETIWALHQSEVTLEELADHIRDYVSRLLQGAKTPHVTVAIEQDMHSLLGAVQSLELFRIVQEALHNALKYAQCTHIQVLLHLRGGQLQVCVEDNGRGIPEAVLTRGASSGSWGFGLDNMRRRAELLGGICQIGNRPEGGGCIHVSISSDPVTLDRLLRTPV